MDRSKQDRLEAEILFLVEKYAAPEFSNLDVARALWECALKRGKREGSTLFDSFLQHQHDQLARTLEVRFNRPDLYQCEAVRKINEQEIEKLQQGCTEVRLVLTDDVIVFAQSRQAEGGHKSLTDYLSSTLHTAMYRDLVSVQAEEEGRDPIQSEERDKLN